MVVEGGVGKLSQASSTIAGARLRLIKNSGECTMGTNGYFRDVIVRGNTLIAKHPSDHFRISSYLN